jgi:AraC-like DNA-binding protein
MTSFGRLMNLSHSEFQEIGPKNAVNVCRRLLTTSRLLITYRISVSASAVMHSSRSDVVATRLAEVLFIQTLRAHIASEVEWRNKGWLRAIFDPQVGAALSAVHDRVNKPWTVESLAEAAGMSRSAFAARFRELLGQTPLEYVTEWRMQKAMQLLQQRDRKLIDVARSVGYESDAGFSKAFKRVVGANPGEYLKRGFEGHRNAGMAKDF